MSRTLRKKKIHKLKKTLRNKHSKKVTFRKTRARKTRARKTRARKAGAPKQLSKDISKESRTARQASVTAKKVAEKEKQRLLAEIAAAEKAQRATKRAVNAATKSAATKRAANAASAAGPSRSGRLQMNDPRVISSIWYTNFDTPLKIVAQKTREESERKGYNEARIKHDIHAAAISKYNEILKTNHIHGASNYYLQKILTQKYYTDKHRVGASMLIHYYAKLMQNGKPVPEKAKTRLRTYLQSDVWNQLTPEQQQALHAIVNSRASPDEEDAYIVTDADLALHNLLQPGYDGLKLTDADIYPELNDSDLADFQRLYPELKDYDGLELTDDDLL